MRVSLSTALVLLSAAFELATTTSLTTANYDDLTRDTLVQTPIGTYKGLTYNAWRRATTGGVAVGGVSSNTPPNRLITSSIEQLTNGTPSLIIAAPYKSFSFYDFYFGCVTRTAETAAAEAVQCTITVDGFDKYGQEKAVASFTFTPPVSPVAPVPMIHAVLPDSFHGPLVNMTIIETDLEIVGLLFDSATYALNK